MTLQWAGVTDATLKGYNVYKAYAPSGPWTKLNSNAFSATSFADAGPGSGTIYYRVAATDAVGESFGANFNLTVAAPPVVNDVLTSVDVPPSRAGRRPSSIPARTTTSPAAATTSAAAMPTGSAGRTSR